MPERESSRRGILIYNPAAGQSDLTQRLERLCRSLASRGLDLSPVPTERQGHIAELIASFDAERTIDLVVACGGDGTINEAAVAMTDRHIPLGILPAGTANVLARELTIPLNLDHAAEVLENGVSAEISVGRANEKPFLMMAGFGLDAMVLHHCNPHLKRRFGRMAIAARCAEEFVRFAVPRLLVRGEDFVSEATLVVAANIRLYGGDFVIAPDADPTDDLLDLVLFKGSTRLDYAKYAAGIVGGRHHLFKDVEVRRVRSATVHAIDSDPVPGQIDGDTVLETPVHLSVQTGAIRILVPSTSSYARSPSSDRGPVAQQS